MLSEGPDHQQRVPKLSPAPVAAGIYRHYKGARYQVLHCARHSETEEWYVVYRCLYGDFSVWVRSLSMFTEQVTLANGNAVPRFELEIVTGFTGSD